ncbi:hypothetical protein ACHMW6_11510 [Pseudoduganella sp. UC29_106]|uniref:hypothetical protein n=1 Tax=Pseudoduganella sp. UC29_106 TaxID=3374553 RepID=UPI00375790AD
MKKFASRVGKLWLVMCVLNPAALAQTIPIGDIEELYSNVNNPANAGATLLLAPGRYVLTTTDPSNVARPKGGRIEFQPNMSIMGVEGDRTQVVIDAIKLPRTSFPNADGPNAAVRMGLGHNALEWLTVSGAANGQANIDTGLQALDPADTSILLAHIASTGSARGANIRNFGPQTSGQTIEADVIDCDFFENPFGVSEGIRMGNFGGAIGSIVNVRMSGNRSWGQQQGRLIVNNTASNSQVNVVSTGNRFYGNGSGTGIGGALTAGPVRADGNTINFEAHGDSYLDNTQFTEFDHGGIVVLGVENVSLEGGGGSNNTVRIQLWGVKLENNGGTDLYVVGARSTFIPGVDPTTSKNNHVTVTIKGNGQGKGRWQPTIYRADSLPGTPDEGNTATVID